MSRYRAQVARALARALLAGEMREDALLARAMAALGERPPWLPAMLAEVFPLSGATWGRLTIAQLGELIERSETFCQAVIASEPPVIRRWFLRSSRMHAPPLGLHDLSLPRLDDSEALARWLQIPLPDLLWLTGSPARRRRLPLDRQHYAFMLKPKRSGGGRLIEAPRRRLKAVQARILDGLLAAVPVHESCHGFVRGRSVRTHAANHVAQPVVVRFDLLDFFPSVSAAQVRAVFETVGYPPGVAQDLTSLCTVATPDAVIERMSDDGWLDAHQAKSLRSAHLPQGAPSSPMLANLCAFQLDLRLAGLAEAMGAHYSRYADDLVFSGPATLHDAFARLAAWVGRIALDEGYRVNHRKTRFMTQAAAQTVCGVVVNRHPNLRRTDFDALRATLHRCAVRGPAAPAGVDLAAWQSHLYGRLTWAEQINPAKARRLRALWDRIAWPDAGGTTMPA